MRAYYNEVDPHAAGWLCALVADGLVPAGDVDDRPIQQVHPGDLAGYGQCHFFAGIGGWAYACRLAGWPDDRPIWTGSCPCQPFSTAGRRRGADDERHLWPDFLRLIRACRPAVVMGEQVAGAAGYGWLDGVRADLAGEGYASRGVDIPASAVDAPHIRSRLYWLAVADGEGERRQGQWACGTGAGRRELPSGGHDPIGRTGLADRGLASGGYSEGRRIIAERGAQGRDVLGPGHPSQDGGGLGDAERQGRQGRAEWAGDVAREFPATERTDGDGDLGHAESVGRGERRPEPELRGWWPTPPRAALPGRNGSFWSGAEWIVCHYGKARRAEPGIPLLAPRVPGRVDAWRGLGNAIVAPLAAEVIAAFLETEGTLAPPLLGGVAGEGVGRG